jgi:hypothetical protein
MTTSYLLRFDDLCPTMDVARWEPVEELLRRSNVKPIVAIVPENGDPNLEVDPPDDRFWERARGWASLGWTIAIHGHRHATVTDDAGLLGIHARSEFAGLSAEEQRAKLAAGLRIFEREGLRPDVFVAPNHSFDATTLRELLAVGIATVSDGFGTLPHRDPDGILWIPQQLWRFRSVPPGVWTICSHTNAWDPARFEAFRRGLEANRSRVVDVGWVEVRHGVRRRAWWDAAAGSVLASATRAKVRRAAGRDQRVREVT